MKLIVNADDFGFHDNATDAIVRCIRDGIVTNTTLMMNMSGTARAIEIAHNEGFKELVGLHINISEGCPLTDDMRKSKLFCNAEGVFRGEIRRNRLLRFWLPASEKQVLAGEIRAQIEAFIRAGFSPFHYDSHGGVHNYLSMLPITLACARDAGFKSTRIFGNMSSDARGGQISFLRKCYIERVKAIINSYGFVHTDYRGYSWDFHRQFSKLQSHVSVEIMCHPQYRLADNTLSMSGKLVDWKTPYEDSIGSILRYRGMVNMMSFKDFAHG